jgi:hypothetical protein
MEIKKTNFDKMFKTNSNMESEGVWFKLAESRFLLKRFGGVHNPKVKSEMARLFKPYAKLIEIGQLDADIERKIFLQLFVNSSMLDWEAVTINDVITPFDTTVAVDLLFGLPDLAKILTDYAQDFGNFKEELGN